MPDAIGGKKIVAGVSPAELERAYAVAAPGSNKFVVNIGHPGVRIAFGERHEELAAPSFFTAVTLHPLDAISLYKVLQDMLKPIEDDFRAGGIITDVPEGNEDGK